MRPNKNSLRPASTGLFTTKTLCLCSQLVKVARAFLMKQRMKRLHTFMSLFLFYCRFDLFNYESLRLLPVSAASAASA